MKKCDFEKYAGDKPKKDGIANQYSNFFYKWVGVSNRDLKVLDFGCGDGKAYNFFRRIFREENIYGADISPTRVNRCISIGWENVFLVKNKKPLPFPDGFFDLINLDNVIEHINREEIDFYLLELRRVLAKGGRMIVCTPNYPVKRVYDLLHSLLALDLKRVWDDSTHVRHYDFGELSRLLRKYFGAVVLEPTGGLLYRIFNYNILSHKIIGFCNKDR